MTKQQTVVVVPSNVDAPRRDRRKGGQVKLSIWNKLARFRARVTSNHMHRARRREAAIHAYVGKNGHGKTLCMVRDTLPTLEGMIWHCDNPDHFHTQKGIVSGVRKVVSTVKLYDAKTGEPHDLYVPLENLEMLRELEHCDLLLDEIVGVMHSRDSAALPPQIQLILNQFRKRDIAVRWTAPAYSRAEKLIRECTTALTLCYGSHPERGGTDLWLPNRSFVFTTYEPDDFDEFSAHRSEKLDASITEYFWAGLEPDVLASYNTRESVLMISHVDDHGSCVVCGGTRRRSGCTCHDYLTKQADVAEKVKASKAAPRTGDTAPVVAFGADETR